MSKLEKEKKPQKGKMASSTFDHPINKLSRGEVLWDDDCVEAMAEGKLPAAPVNWDKILKPVDPNVVKQDEEVRTCQEAIEKAVCPKCSRNPFQFFDDAAWASDGEEVKHCNVFCQGTESSPCSQCSEDSQTKNPPRKKTKQEKVTETNALVQAKGFHKEDFEGEEETPQKISADACKWCQLEPCIVDDEETEGKMIVDNLNAQEGSEMNNFRFALCRMCARQLGCVGERHILPRCVCLFIEANFVEAGEKRTGFKPKAMKKQRQRHGWQNE